MENEKIVVFEAPFGGLGATYAVQLRLIGKLVGDFLLVMIELFFARCFRFVTIHAFDRQTDRQNLDHNTVRMLRSRTVKMLFSCLCSSYSLSQKCCPKAIIGTKY